MTATVSTPSFLRKHKWDGVGDPCVDKKRIVETPSFAADHEYLWDEAIERLSF